MHLLKLTLVDLQWRWMQILAFVAKLAEVDDGGSVEDGAVVADLERQSLQRAHVHLAEVRLVGEDCDLFS